MTTESNVHSPRSYFALSCLRGGVLEIQAKRDSLISGVLFAIGFAGVTVSALAIPRGGIGWDSGIDTFAAQNVRQVDSDGSLIEAYEQIFSTAEFYGVLVQWTADLIYQVLGNLVPQASDYAASFQLQATVTLALSVLSAIVAGFAVSVLFSSRTAGAFTFAAITTLPYLSGMSAINLKDAPVAAGLTTLSAGAALLWRFTTWKYLLVAAGLIAIGTFVALGVRIGAWVLVGAVVTINIIAMAVWLNLTSEHRIFVRSTTATVVGVGFGVAAVWLLNPIARIDLPRWAWDAFLVSRSYPWIGDVRTMGQDLPSTDLPWWYLPAWFSAQMPVLFLGFALLGIVIWTWQVLRDFTDTRLITSDEDSPRAVALTPFAVQAVVLPAGMVVIGATLYDGIRHITFALPALIVLMAPLIVRITNVGLASERPSVGIAWLVATALIAVPATNLLASIRWFPYMYAHVNVPTAFLDSDRDWEYDYWGTSVVEGAQRLRELGVDKVVVLPEIDPRGTAEVARITRAEELTSEEPYGLYVFRRYDTSIPEFGCERVFEIKRAGVILGEGAICDGNVRPVP